MNDATQTGVAMACIAMVSTVIGLIVGYFKDRDKLRYDAELAGLKSQNATQAKQIEDLTRRDQECQEKHRETLARVVELERALAGKKDRPVAVEPIGAPGHA